MLKQAVQQLPEPQKSTLLGLLKEPKNLPNQYARNKAAKAFFEALSRKYQLTPEQVWNFDPKTGLLCHPLAALGYGRWLSPDFEVVCMEIVFRHFQGK